MPIIPVSIVIPTFDRPQVLRRLLPTYLDQGCAEIIIVDDQSGTPVATVLNEGPNIRIIRNQKRLYAPTSRMVGINAATQPFIFFGEDDVYLTPGYIQNLYSYVHAGIADIASSTLVNTDRYGQQVVENLRMVEHPQDIVDHREIRFYGNRKAVKPIFVPHLHAIALMRKNLIQRFPFDPIYEGNGFREETDFFLSAYASGAKLAFVPGPAAFHYKGSDNISGGQHKSSVIGGLAWYEFHAARNNFRLLKKHSGTLRCLGLPNSPLWGTTTFILRRLHGYPGRLRAALKGKVQQLRREVATGV